MKPTKKKSSNVNITSKTSATKPTKYVNYTTDFRLDLNTLRQTPFTQETLENLGEKMISWALASDDHLILNQFLIIQGMSNKDLSDFMDRCPRLREAREQVRMILGTRRELRALKREIEPNTFKHMQSFYDADWKAQDEYNSKLKSSSDNGMSTELLDLCKDIIFNAARKVEVDKNNEFMKKYEYKSEEK